MLGHKAIESKAGFSACSQSHAMCVSWLLPSEHNKVRWCWHCVPQSFSALTKLFSGVKYSQHVECVLSTAIWDLLQEAHLFSELLHNKGDLKQDVLSCLLDWKNHLSGQWLKVLSFMMWNVLIAKQTNKNYRMS